MEIRYNTFWYDGKEGDKEAESSARRLGMSIARDLREALKVKHVNAYTNFKERKYDLVTITNLEDFFAQEHLNFVQLYFRGNNGDVMLYLGLDSQLMEHNKEKYRGMVKLCSDSKTLDTLIPVLDKYVL